MVAEYAPTDRLQVVGRTILRSELEAQAVEFCQAGLEAGKDWQEVQHDLLNGRYAPLFASATGDGEVSDQDGEYTMRLIREAEEALGYC